MQAGMADDTLEAALAGAAAWQAWDGHRAISALVECPDTPTSAAERLDASRPVWWPLAACRGAGVELFFGDDPAPALALCASCAAREPCGDLAFSARLTDGVFGGLRPEDRTRCRNCGAEPVQSRGRCAACAVYRARRGVERPAELWQQAG